MVSVNNAYGNENNRMQIRKQYKSEASVLLQSFLEKDLYAHLAKELKSISWKKDYVPQTRSFRIASDVPLAIKALLKDAAVIKEFVQEITQTKLSIVSLSLKALEAGDYVLQHEKQTPGVHILLELTPLWHPSWGGFTSVVENGEETVRVDPFPNTLSIIKQASNQSLMVKYINHHAKTNMRTVLHIIAK